MLNNRLLALFSQCLSLVGAVINSSVDVPVDVTSFIVIVEGVIVNGKCC
jgi:hypothetical protein